MEENPRHIFSGAWYEPYPLEPGPVLHPNYWCTPDSSSVIVFESHGWKCVLWSELQAFFCIGNISSQYHSSYSVVWNSEGESETWNLIEPCDWRRYQTKLLEESYFQKVSYLKQYTCIFYLAWLVKGQKWPKWATMLNALPKEALSR